MDDFSLNVTSPPPWEEQVEGDDVEGRDLFLDLLSPEPGDFVPDSLVAFINEAKATLQDAQLSLQTHFAASPMSTTIGGDDDDWRTPKHNGMLEDDDDRRLREELLNKFERKQLVSPHSDVPTSPSPMNTSGMTVPSGQKSTPRRGELSEDIFMTPGFVNFNGDDCSLLVEEEFSPAMEYLEPDLMVDRTVERPHGAETMTIQKLVPTGALGTPTIETLRSLQTRFDQTKGTPVSMSVTPEIKPISVTHMTPRGVSNTPAVKPSASQLTSEPPQPVESESKNPATPMATFAATKPEKIIPASSERKRTSHLRLSGRKVAPMPLPSAPSPINPSPASEAKPRRLVVKAVEIASKSVTSTPVSNTATLHCMPSYNISPQRESLYDRLSKPKTSAAEHKPAATQFPTTPQSVQNKTAEHMLSTALSTETPPHPEAMGAQKLNVTPRSSERQKALGNRLAETPKAAVLVKPIERVETKETSVPAADVKAPATKACATRVESAVSPRAKVHELSETAPVDDTAFLPPVIDLGDSSICDFDDAFLPNSKTITVLTASEPKKIVSLKTVKKFITHKVEAKPSVTKRATIPKPSVSMAFGRPSQTTAKPKTVAPPPPKSLPTTTRLQNFVPSPLPPKTTHFAMSTTRPTRTGPNSIAANEKIPDDGVAKARARIRQRQLLDKQKQSAELVAKSETMLTKSVLRHKPVGADEGRARARERVRQQQQPLHPEAKTSEAKLRRMVVVERAQAVVSIPKPPVPVPTSLQETNHSKFIPAPPSVRPIRPHLTIPKGPRLSMTAKYGEKPTPSVQERKEQPYAQTSMRSISEPRGLTVPKGPKLSTQAKYGDKPPPSLWEEKQKQLETKVDGTRIQSERPRLTKPVPFNFRVSKMTTPARSKEKDTLSLAECELFFMQKGLREDLPAMDTTRELTLTIPKSPNFTPIVRRSVPQSTAEKEEEIMDYYNSHPFKASQVRLSMSSNKGQGVGIPKVEKRRVTMPEPFHLKSEVRASKSNSAPVPTEEERAIADLEECKKQFQARPLPNLSFRSPSKSEAFRPKAVTTPEPFRLMSEERRAKVEPPQPTEDDKEMEKQFKARPLPISTFIAPPPRRTADGIPLTIITKEQSNILPPKLATSDRTEKREAAKEASRQNAEIVAKQKERMRVRKQHEKHLEDMANAKLCSPTTPTQAEPFQLSSTIRHESCQRRLEEKRQEDLETEKRRRSFLARPMQLTPPPPPRVLTHKPVTQVQPFQLMSTIRHDRHEAERRAKEEEEEQERRRLATIKARPLPNFQIYKPITPTASQNLVEPRSLELASSRRAQERKAFDEKVDRDKQEEAAIKKAIGDQKTAEQAAELQELRRLPVSEGGLIQRANPINAGLAKGERGTS
jgi:Targeting protein for Xklp2 (TPX2) domain